MSLSVRKTPRGLEESLTKTSTMHTSTGGYYDSRSDKDVQSVFDLYDRFLFPMITEINRCCPTYAIVFYPSMLFIFAQLFLSGFFTYYDFEGNVSGIFQIFRKIFFFGLGGTYAQMKVSQFVLPCINYLSILTLIVIFISYNNSHEFSSWHKFVLRNWHGGFAIILLIPHLYSFVSSMSSYINDNGEHMYECFIMNLISVIYAIFELLFLSIPLLSSPFLSNVKTILWRPNEFIMGILYIAVPITLMAFDNPKEKWSLLLSPILLFILSPFAFKFFISFPFSGIVFNALSISMPIFLDIMAFYAIIRLYIYMPPVLIRYLIPPVCYVIVNVIAVILFYRFRKKVKQTLTYNSADIEELEKNDIMKKEYFENMKPIPKYLIYFYLQVGLEEACDFFLDWSFSRYLIELYPGDDCILLFTTWLVFFFPSESSFLHSLVTLLFKIKNRTYFNNIVFYQLHRVHIFRQSSASPEVLTDFSRVRKASQLCVSTISQFWYGNSTVYNDIDSVFPYLAHHRKTADTLWIEMLDKYPNHAGFAKQYSSYLLDAKSKFLEAIFWHQKATALENGSIGQNDKMFSRFVRAFPFYLKSGIVDTGGNLRRGAGKQANIARKGSFNTVSSSGHSSTDGSFDIDIEEAQTFLPLMNLRIAVERAIEGCSLKSVSFITWTSLFRLILSSAFVIIVYYVLVHATDKNLLLFNSVSKFFEVSNYLNLLSVEIVQFYFEAVDGMHYEPSKIVDPYINFTADINLTIVNLTRMAITEMDNFIRGIFETGNVNGIGDLMSEQLIDNHICDENANLVVINQSITIDYFIRSHLLNLINLAKDNFTSRKSYNQDPSFCQFFVKTQILQTIMENLTSYVSNIYDKAIETDLLNNMNKSTHYELESSKMDSTESLCAFFISLSPFILFFLSVPSLMSLSVGIKNRRTKIRLIIESIPLDDRIEAAKTIRPDLFANSEENLLIPKQFKQNICGPWFFLFISTMLVSNSRKWKWYLLKITKTF